MMRVFVEKKGIRPGLGNNNTTEQMHIKRNVYGSKFITNSIELLMSSERFLR